MMYDASTGDYVIAGLFNIVIPKYQLGPGVASDLQPTLSIVLFSPSRHIGDI
jgi:hypothetical protein